MARKVDWKEVLLVGSLMGMGVFSAILLSAVFGLLTLFGPLVIGGGVFMLLIIYAGPAFACMREQKEREELDRLIESIGGGKS